MKTIAHIETDFPEKFGLPRQSGLVPELTGRIIFEKEYRNEDALRGLNDFSHIWIIWEFSENIREEFSPTVRPPRLGGDTRLGVFATRSPFRPNPIGLSCVRLVGIDFEAENGPVIIVSGIDMMNGTPIYDIKPYIPSSDCVTDATRGFSAINEDYRLEVVLPDDMEEFPEEKIPALTGFLSEDPRPAYHEDADRIYGVAFMNYNIRFKVMGKKLTILEIVNLK